MGLIDKIYIMTKIHEYTETDWKEIRVYFLLATKNESASRYCFRLISLFSNRVASVFRRTSRVKAALVLFFWSPLLNFDIIWRKIISSFLIVSTKLQKFGWDLNILLLNRLFHPNKNAILYFTYPIGDVWCHLTLLINVIVDNKKFFSFITCNKGVSRFFIRSSWWHNRWNLECRKIQDQNQMNIQRRISWKDVVF